MLCSASTIPVRTIIDEEVTLTDRAKAEGEARCPGQQVLLIQCGDNGRIEDRVYHLQGIIHGEIGPEQSLARGTLAEADQQADMVAHAENAPAKLPRCHDVRGHIAEASPRQCARFHLPSNSTHARYGWRVCC